MKRRSFIQSSVLSSIGLVNGIKCLSPLTCRQQDHLQQARRLLRSSLTIDTHSHAGALEGRGLEEELLFNYVGDLRQKQIFDEMIKADLKATYLCITSDWNLIDFESGGNMKRLFSRGEAWKEYLRQVGIFQDPEFMEMMPIKLATTIEDIDIINEEDKLAVFLSTEGGHMVENDLDRMAALYRDGIRRFQPIHYVSTILGDNQTDAPKYNGLSDLGKESIQEASTLRMIIDVAHASFDCCRQIAEMTNNPLVLSHSMMLFGDYNHPRWITPDHAGLIADTGGYIGIWPAPKPHGFDSADDFIDAIFRMIDVVGIDHVGWSTDYIGGHHDSSPVFNNYHQFPEIIAKLLSRGISENDLIKLIGGNAARVHREVVG